MAEQSMGLLKLYTVTLDALCTFAALATTVTAFDKDIKSDCAVDALHH